MNYETAYALIKYFLRSEEAQAALETHLGHTNCFYLEDLFPLMGKESYSWLSNKVDKDTEKATKTAINLFRSMADSLELRLYELKEKEVFAKDMSL
jgi:hypothetical protein